MLRMKPEMHSGKMMMRATRMEGGVRTIASSTVLHSPGVKLQHVVLPMEQLIDGALNSIVTVSDQTGPEVQAMALVFRKKLRMVLSGWMKRAAINERELCIKLLRANGLEVAASSLERNNYQPE